jgi:hypothetical protein
MESEESYEPTYPLHKDNKEVFDRESSEELTVENHLAPHQFPFETEEHLIKNEDEDYQKPIS